MYKMIWFSLNFLCILQTVHYVYFMAPLWLRLFPVYILWYIEFPQFFFWQTATLSVGEECDTQIAVKYGHLITDNPCAVQTTFQIPDM